MNLRHRLAAALATALIAVPALAATPINQTRPLNADGSVSISNVAGRITVRTWDQPQVKITGSLGNGVEKLLVEGDASNLTIEVKYPEHNGWGWGDRGNRIEDTILEVTLPRKASVDVTAVSAEVDVQGSFGRRLDIDSVSGDVVVAKSAPGEVDIEAVSGNVNAWLDTDDLSVSTVSGDANVHGAITGDVDLNSVSGDVQLAARALKRLKVNTVSGDADVNVALAEGARLEGESVSGNVTVRLPANTSARLSLESFSGDIDSPVGHVEEEEHGPGSSLEAKLGGGSALVDVETLSGDIDIVTGGKSGD
jgi:DUF4097 and DUF4098 domain-containing protein YvlB